MIGPPLNRCLLLVGADCLAWLAELPRTRTPALTLPSRAGQVNLSPDHLVTCHLATFQIIPQVISQYFVSRRCAACSGPAVKPLCARCGSSSARAAALLSWRLAAAQGARERVEGECVGCCGPAGGSCSSTDCPAMYRRRQAEARVGELVLLRSILEGLTL